MFPRSPKPGLYQLLPCEWLWVCSRLEVLSPHEVLQPLPEGGEGSKLQHSACASLLAHNVYPAVQVTRF